MCLCAAGYNNASETKKHDADAIRYLSYVLYPLILCYAVWALYYETHKSWYSFILNTLVGAVYTFGFILMCPQVSPLYFFTGPRTKSISYVCLCLLLGYCSCVRVSGFTCCSCISSTSTNRMKIKLHGRFAKTTVSKGHRHSSVTCWEFDLGKSSMKLGSLFYQLSEHVFHITTAIEYEAQALT